MSEILAPLVSAYALQIPVDPGALIGWVIGFIGIIGVSLRLRDRHFRLDRSTLIWSAILSVMILVLTPFVGILPRMSPAFGTGEVPVRHLMFFAAIPWMVAGGALGVLPATLLGGISGLLMAYLDTQNIFTPLVLMGVAVVFSWSVRQRFRTMLFKWLRFPIVAAVVSLVFTSPLVFLALALSVPGPTAARVATAIQRFPVVIFALGGMVLIGGVVCVIVQAFAQERWGVNLPLSPAQGELHFKNRLLAYTLPILLIVLAALFVSTWSIVQNNARTMLVRQMTGTTRMAADSLSVFVEVGERQIIGLASDLAVFSDPSDSVFALMDQNLHTFQYFDHFALFDADGSLVAGLPANTISELIANSDWAGFIETLSAAEDPYILMSDAGDDDHGTHVTFMIAVGNQPGESQFILAGQTVLEENLYAQPFMRAMDELARQGGYGEVVRFDGSSLYHTDGAGADERFSGSSYATATFYQSTTEDGRTLVHYYQPVDGTNLGIAATLPAFAIQEMAWQTTYPVVLIAAGVMTIILLGVWIGLSPLVSEMDSMAAAIDAVAAGNFDIGHLSQPSKRGGGHFSKAFQTMIASQKSRMDSQAELLTLSSRIAGQLNTKDSLHIILASALTQGASSARVVLTDSAFSASPDDTETCLGMGKHTRMLALLDQEVLDLSRGEGLAVLMGDEIVEKLPSAEMIPDLVSVILIPLKWKDLGLGVFWVAFPDSPSSEDDVVEYLKDLGQMASMAIVNARTYEDSQSSRALMESIFNLLPDAILISDQNGQVLFQNKNAQRVLRLDGRTLEGKTLSSLFGAEELAEFTTHKAPGPQGREIHFKDGRAFYLISSSIRINPRQAGRVLIFKDLTQQKLDDSIKSEFVTTVSHELRSPLTLILGYAKILRLTGNLNEQQDAYINNIIDGVEEMKDLVQKLLDIGRLEGGDPLNIHQFTAEDITGRVVESMDAQAKQKNIHISVNLPDNPLVIEADQTFLAQALKNLLENAIKFSKMESEVVMSVRQKEDHVIFKVEDKGIGIAPLDQRNLFKKFSRTSAQTGMENEGSGLGLAIVKSIAERHGGKVSLESQLGKGSSFYFEIPLKQPR